MTVPNIISIARIILVPVFCVLYFLPGMKGIAFAVIIISGISDLLDGMIARKFNQISDLGKVLDPIADKLFHLSTVFCFCLDKVVSWIFFAFMIAKELFMIIGGIVFYKKTEGGVIASKWYGKLTSSILFSTFMIAFFLDFADVKHEITTVVLSVLFCIALAFSISTVISYTKTAIKINNEKKAAKKLQ